MDELCEQASLETHRNRPPTRREATDTGCDRETCCRKHCCRVNRNLLNIATRQSSNVSPLRWCWNRAVVVPVLGPLVIGCLTSLSRNSRRCHARCGSRLLLLLLPRWDLKTHQSPCPSYGSGSTDSRSSHEPSRVARHTGFDSAVYTATQIRD